jgi:thiol-disulfide isomerase/thioredoxin
MRNPEGAEPVVGHVRPARIVIVVLVLVVAVGAGFVAFSGSDSAPAPDPAPEATFTYFDGTQGSFADFEGKPVVVNFWASWCPACIAEMPGIEATFKRFEGEVVFIGFDVQDTRDNALRLVEETGVTYLLADDPDGLLLSAFGGIAMPTTVFIDADGGVVETFSGFLTEDLLVERIETLLLQG